MWVIGIIFILIVFAIILILVTSKNSKRESTPAKKEYAMPPQKRYPNFYFKDCFFYADGSSRFAYSDDEIEQLLFSLEESFNRAEYSKTIKLANEIVKVIPKTDKAWIKKISAIYMEVMQKEIPWNEKYSRIILNCCYGFLQCYDNVLEKSIAAKHVLLPILLKNTEELIRYQENNITKYHNFEVYNMLLNMYHIIPFKEILGIISNKILENKFDKELEKDVYATQMLKNLLGQVDMLRTRNTSRLQESFDNKKITNCTLITDERISASIVAFELSYDVGSKKETIEAIFFDENGKEISFGKEPNKHYIEMFETNSDRGVTVKEEIVILTDVAINKVKIRIYNESNDNNLYNKKIEKEVSEKNSNKDSNNISKEQIEKQEIKLKDISDNDENNNDSKAEIEEMEAFPNGKTNNLQTLLYPSFDKIKDVKISDTQFIGLKENGTVIAIGIGSYIKQVSTWKDISKIYLKNDVAFGIREDGTVIYEGKCEYDKAEYIYSWENIDSLSLGEKHLVALTKNLTAYAIGSNINGECDVDNWYDVIQVETAYHTVGLCKDGRVLATGENNFGECDVKSWQDIVQIAVGEFYTLGLTASGKVLATGLNSCGQCNVGEWANIKKIFAKGNMSIGLRYDGKVVTAGKNSYRYDDVKKWTRIKDVFVSNNRIIGIEQDGTVKATGKPYRNFVPDEWNNTKSIAINNNNIVALKEDGTLICNGMLFGQCLASNFDGILQICEDSVNNRIAMLSDKNVLTISNKIQNSGVEEVYPILYDIKKIDMSTTHLVALKMDGKALYVNLNDRSVVNIDNWENIIDVKAGDGFILGLNISGKVVSMSSNEYKNYEVSDWSDIVKIDAKGKRAMGLTIDGKLLMVGTSEFGEGDFIAILKHIRDFALTNLQTMVLESDGTVKVTYHPTGVGTEGVKVWKNIKRVVARGDNFLCLGEDGKVYSTIENEVEIPSWEEIEDINASENYVWATLKL